jgi:RecA-family ATPase
MSGYHDHYKPKEEYIRKESYMFRAVEVGEYGIISGRGGCGKSLYVLDFFTNKENPLNYKITPKKILYISLEDSLSKVSQRFKDLSNFESYHDFFVTRFDSFNAIKFSDKEEHIKKWKDFDIVVIDTLSKAHGVDENDNSQMSQFFGLIQSICIEAECSVLFVAHTAKGGSTSRGASAIEDNSRLALKIEKSANSDAIKVSTNKTNSNEFIKDTFFIEDKKIVRKNLDI